MQTVNPFHQVTRIQTFKRFYPGDIGMDLHVHSLKTQNFFLYWTINDNLTVVSCRYFNKNFKLI